MPVSRIALIYNPSAGRPRERQRAIDRLTARLTEAGVAVDLCPTEGPNHATELAQAAVARGCEMVVAHGGDGTMHEVLQALVHTNVTLAFWPGGTANVLAHEINFPAGVEAVCQRILAGRVQRVTVGRANNRYFLLMAGIGIDAAVASGVDPQLKRLLGKVAFGISAVRFILDWNLRPVRVHLPGEEVIARFVVAGNGRSYGGGFQFTPMASLADPHLDLCIFESDRRSDYLRYALAALRGRHREMPGVTYRKVEHATISSAALQAAPVQLDGEVTGGLPLELEAVPAALNLLQ